MECAPAVSLRGALRVPGDKSISHRALLVGAVSESEAVVRGFGRSLDTESTLAAVRSLGVTVEEDEPDVLRVLGVGLNGLREPNAPIDCGNAGTLARLLPGLLAGQAGYRFDVTGDESLRSRPMERIALPLSEMGAVVEMDEGRLPLRIDGRALTGIEHEPAVASAQVKSCVLLAGLLAEGQTTVVERIPTRDHTERMLRTAGAAVTARMTAAGNRISVTRARHLQLGDVDVPGDVSAAAPFIVAATLLPGSELILQGVGVNPTRIGLLDALERMGARIAIFNRRAQSGEPVADLEVTHAELVATEIVPAEVPRMIDELPLFALAAAMARGTSRVRGAAELRAKESDRIETVATALRAVGSRVQTSAGGFTVRGVPTRLRGGTVDSAGDHRLAMLGAVAGLVSQEGVRVQGAEAAAVSFPGFYELLDSLSHR
jgi:3-phosphoshikimate 1-carboxyvinyltransferase